MTRAAWAFFVCGFISSDRLDQSAGLNPPGLRHHGVRVALPRLAVLGHEVRHEQAQLMRRVVRLVVLVERQLGMGDADGRLHPLVNNSAGSTPSRAATFNSTNVGRVLSASVGNGPWPRPPRLAPQIAETVDLVLRRAGREGFVAILEELHETATSTASSFSRGRGGGVGCARSRHRSVGQRNIAHRRRGDRAGICADGLPADLGARERPRCRS